METMEQIIEKAIEDDFGNRGWNTDTYWSGPGTNYRGVSLNAGQLSHAVARVIREWLAGAEPVAKAEDDEIRVRID